MNRNRLMVGLAVAVLLAFILSAYVYHAFRKAEVSASAPVMHMTNIVVANEPLKIGTRLDASKVKTIQWPSGAKPSGMFSDITEVANRAVINNIAENEPILADNLAAVESGAGLSATIPEGMRAVSVAVNDVVGVAGFVTPGTMVDVLVTGNAIGGASGGTSITRTILENVRVLAAGQKMEQDREGKPENVPVITLLVTPEDAAKLTMASTEGKIQLSLRNTVDNKTTSPAPVLQASLFSGGGPAVAAASVREKHVVMHKDAPPPPYAVEVITGDKHEVKNFPNP